MAGCPTCQFEINIPSENHGSLMTCPNCQAVFFVNWDGAPEAPILAEEEPSSDFASGSEISETPLSENFQYPDQQLATEGVPQFESTEVQAFEAGGVEVYAAERSDSVSFSTAEAEAYVETEPAAFTEVAPETELPPFDGAQAESIPLTPQQFVDEVIDFGNSTEPVEGLTYSVRILGIDSGTSREKLEDILREPRLVFDLQNLMAEIQNGQLDIQNLNAAKAFFLVQKLKQEAFDVSWFQQV